MANHASAGKPFYLSAGPIRLKFQDGELRYLRVGEREIVRRVYFAAREMDFDTAMPTFTQMEVQDNGECFFIKLSAVCNGPTIDFRWQGFIEGTAEGKIIFTVSGSSPNGFQSPRVGLCLLFGVEALAGTPFEVTDVQGKIEQGTFPRDVSPTFLVSNHFNELRYRCADGLAVRCGLTNRGSGMEDQRNYCDSSYKAYHSMDFPYPTVPAGMERADSCTLEVTGAPHTAHGRKVVHVSLRPNEGLRLPLLPAEAPLIDSLAFVTLNEHREPYVDAEQITWEYNPSAHLPDNDMFMENVSAIIDQVRTVRTFAPRAKIRIDPIHFTWPHPLAAPDPRIGKPFAAAWTAVMLTFLARAGVDEAVFAVGPGPSEDLLRHFRRYAGHPVRVADISGPYPQPVQALAIGDGNDLRIWLINMTDAPQRLVFGEQYCSQCEIELEPYEVREIDAGNQ
ncbi:MAG TPA: hypothetical protein VGM23_11485, partial [Armatimonadota bacterium]